MPWIWTILNPVCPGRAQHLTLCVWTWSIFTQCCGSGMLCFGSRELTFLIIPFSDSMHLSRPIKTYYTFRRFQSGQTVSLWILCFVIWDDLINAYRSLVLIHLLVCEVGHLLERIHRDEHRAWSYSTVNMIGILENKGHTTISYQ